MHYKFFWLILFSALILFPFLLRGDKENVFSFWTIQLRAPAKDLIQKNIDEFQKLHPEIKIVWVDIPVSEAQKRTIASILGGNPPDLINLNPEYSALLAQKNLLEFFDENDVSPYIETLLEKLKYEGKIYALPFYATSAVSIYNKEKFKNCPLPLKYDDILKLKSCKADLKYGAALNEGDAFSKILNKYSAKTPLEFEEVYMLFEKLKNENLLLNDILTVNHREVVEKYMAGSADFITAGSNFINMILQNAPQVYTISEIAPQLTGKNGRYDISLMNFVIPKKAKNKALAKEFAKMLLNEENQLELAKKTNVLPANKRALSNSYFKNCTSDLIDKARCISSKQLVMPLEDNFGYKNKKQIDETINTQLETLFINGKKGFDPVQTVKTIEALKKE
ncbi:MAG: ABC transporter substrate-binding protein [Candidatus Gastranaerophilales bacterium]|nr:ABC transporter substrate-binding protein [Candidatus Gastranaerophilales bacterium]